MQRTISLPLLLATFNRVAPQQRYRLDEVSPHFWPNGKMPVRDDWKRLAADHFRNYRLQVRGLVENPVELSLSELRAFGMEEFVTMHHCIQGWTGIAQWKGVPMSALIDLVSRPAAHTVVFFSFGDGLYGGGYYETQRFEDVLQPHRPSALEMNRRPLPEVYGAPLRLRVENQLGYKMVKWVDGLSSLNPRSGSAKGKAARTKTTNTSICCQTSERRNRSSTCGRSRSNNPRGPVSRHAPAPEPRSCVGCCVASGAGPDDAPGSTSPLPRARRYRAPWPCND